MSLELKPEDLVDIPQFKRSGKIVSGPNAKDEFLVRVGGMEIWVPRNQLKPSASKSGKKNKAAKSSQDRKSAPEAQISLGPILTVDLHGLTRESALRALETALDQAILQNSPEIHAIHGKGTGSLKQTVFDYFSSSPHINRVRQPLENPGLTIGYL